MRRMTRLLLLVIVVVVVVGGYFLMKRSQRAGNGLLPPADDTAAKGYTAVFLNNDQVYFGKLSQDNEALVLKDVYYIRLNNQAADATKTTDQPQLTLVKLGDQIHGPTDEMRINPDQVLFTERIKDESTVVKAILQEKEGRDKAAATPAASNTAETPANTQ